MTRKEDMAALRACTEVHYNCAQSVILPFTGDMGMDRDQLYALALNFGGGMGCGGTCGAMIGALIALGGLGQPQEKRLDLIRRFRAENGAAARDDIILALNRLSSLCWIIEIKLKAGKYS